MYSECNASLEKASGAFWQHLGNRVGDHPTLAVKEIGASNLLDFKVY